MEHTAFTFENVNNVLERVDYTDKLTVSSGTYSGEACTTLTIPFDTTNTFRYVSSYHIENLSASHEYNLKFKASCSVLTSVGNTVLGVYLVFYNGDTILKEQELGGCQFNSLGWQEVDFDFKPDASGLGGYKTRLEFRFLSVTSAAVIYRLSDIIEFTDKDDNSNWFQRIINAIKEIPEKIGDLRDNISNYFSNLGDRITAKFENVGTSITNKFEEVKNAIGSWFTEIGDKLSNKFAEVGNSITSKFQEIGAEFSATFDKFKPRVYEVFNWRYGWVNSDSIDYFDEDLGAAIISDGFYVPAGTSYIFNVEPSDFLSQEYFEMFQIDIFYFEDGTFRYFESTSLDLFVYYYNDGFELPSGFTYYFALTSFDGTFDSYLNGVSLSDFCNSVVKVYADEGWLTAFGRMILNGIKGFFIPSPDYFDTVYNRVTDLFESKFGIFAQTTTLFFDILREIEDVFDTDSYQFVFPEISVPIGDITITIIERQTVDMNQWLDGDGFGSKLYDIYNLCVWAIIIYCVLVYALRVESTIFGSSKGIDWDLELHHSPDISSDSSDVSSGRRHSGRRH